MRQGDTKAVIEQDIGCMDGEPNPNAFIISIKDKSGENIDIHIVNELELIGPLIGKIKTNRRVRVLNDFKQKKA